MKTFPQTFRRLQELLRTGPKTIAGLKETMIPEGHDWDDVETAAECLDAINVTIGKGRSKMKGWKLP